jgi:hypothetical protein
MFALAHQYDDPVAWAGVTYSARVYGDQQPDGRWAGWILFFPIHPGGRPISTDRETTQSSLADLTYWASGLTPTYLHGALERARALQPEAQLARELARLERLEESAELRAETLEAAASVARADSELLEAARERTEERLLETVATAAEAEAEAHEVAAELSREEARAAERALKLRKGAGSAKTGPVTTKRKPALSKKKR